MSRPPKLGDRRAMLLPHMLAPPPAPAPGETYLVAWRGRSAGAWELQPRLYNLDQADRLARRLVEDFGGEAVHLAVNLEAAENAP